MGNAAIYRKTCIADGVVFNSVVLFVILPSYFSFLNQSVLLYCLHLLVKTKVILK